MIGADPRPPGPRGGAWLRAGTLGGVFTVAAAVALAGIGRPAYWVDEATTVMLVHWRWHDLLGVIAGPEAPLGPYYLLMKPWTAVCSAEWWARLPSALPLAGAVTVLTGWARAQLGTASALAGSMMMICLPAFSRFAQEVRPYGLMVLAVTLCSLAWWRWQQRGGRRAAALYALSVAVLPLLHVLALTLVAAQLAATMTGTARQRASAGAHGTATGTRARASGVAVHTAALAALGLAPVLPYVLLVRSQAMGVAYPIPLTWQNAWSTFASSLAGPPRTDWLTSELATAVLALAIIGLTGLRDPRHRPALGYLACWAGIPPVLLASASFAWPTLVPRYFMVSLPAWSLLAGQGCAILGRAVTALLTTRTSSGRAATSAGLTAGLTAGLVTGVMPLAAIGVGGLPHQVRYRTPAGHGNGDVRPAVSLLNSDPYRGLPVAVLPAAWWVIPADAYDPTLPARTLLAAGPALGADRHITLEDVDPGTAEQRLVGIRNIAVLVYTGDPYLARLTAARSPLLRGFGVTEVTSFDGWSVVALTRS